jgi:hypothetical protein
LEKFEKDEISGMEPVEVTVRFDLQGKAYPQQFVRGGLVYILTSTGRRWQDQSGEHLLLHILVMTAEEITYELVFDPLELRWYLNPAGASRKIALSS